MVEVYKQYLCHLDPRRTIVNLLRASTVTTYMTIKFTTTWSAEKVTFLDSMVYLPYGLHTSTVAVWCTYHTATILYSMVYLPYGLIGNYLYVKPTDKHQYLCMDSCHPKHCKSSIPLSQALQLRRIPSEDRFYEPRTRSRESHNLKTVWTT